MADVFISYSRKDKDFVKALHSALIQRNRETWVDWEDIPLTADWWRESRAGIETADTFVFVVSPDSIASQICCQEIAHAVHHHKRLVPVVWRDNFDIERVYPTLRKHNWLSFRSQDDFETALRSLLKAIDTDLDRVRQHTRLLTHAIEWQNKDKNSDLLLRSTELEKTIQWLMQNAEKEPRSTDLQREYVNASRKSNLAKQEAEIERQKAEVAKQKKLRQATNAALIAVMSGLVIATGLGIFAFRQYQTAETSRKIARVNEIKALNTSSNALFHSNQDLDALVTALKAVSLVKASPWADSETQNQVRSTLQQAIYGAQRQNRIEGKPGVSIANLSPDGKLVALGNAQGEVKLQSVDGQKLQTLKGHSDLITDLSFSSDGNMLLTASRDGTVKLWSIDGKKLKSFEMRDATAAQSNPDTKTFIFNASANGSPGSKIFVTKNNKLIKFQNAQILQYSQLIAHSCDQLKDYLINHPETLKDITACHNFTLLAQASATLVRRGEKLARTGDVKGAIAQFQQAKEWNPQLDLNAETMAQRLADRGEGERLISEGEDLAKADNVEGAIAKFQTAQKLGAELNTDPKLKAQQLAAVSLITKAEELAQQGEVKQAIANFNRAKLLAPTLKISVDSLDNLCWYGSLYGHATQVMDACEKAVAFAPPTEVGHHRDSRGIARAMVGDREGAIADFEAYIAWAEDPSRQATRKRWIASLRKGKNPFTPKEIESLLY